MSWANISVTLYDGEFDVSFDCSGASKCEFALCEFMPPETDDGCVHKKYGTCHNQESRIAAMRSVRNRLKRAMGRAGDEES